MAGSIIGRLKAYLGPLILFSIAAILLPVNIVKHPLMLITSPGLFRDKWFESLWNVIGQGRAAQTVQAACIEELMSRARGTVLEVGPGTGEQSHHFKPDQISKIYGIEPNQFLHAKLIEKAKATGLEGKYVPLIAGGEPSSLIPALQKQGLLPSGSNTLPEDGIFDTIIGVKVFCSLPKEHTAASLAIYQRLLKPQGEFLFFEHVENHTDQLTQSIVALFGWIWPYFTGGCQLTGKMDRMVQGMGGWSQRRVQTTEDFQGYEILRFVKGICVKA